MKMMKERMCDAYDSEVELTEKVFDAMGKVMGPEYIMDFSDDPCNEIYVTNTDTDECFTIKITQDE